MASTPSHFALEAAATSTSTSTSSVNSPANASTLGIPTGPPSTTATFSPVTFAAAVGACVLVFVIISLLVYLMRRFKCHQPIGGDLPNPQPPHRVWVRIGGSNNSAKCAAAAGLDASLIRSFPVMIYSSEKSAAAAAELTENLVSHSESQELHKQVQPVTTVVVADGDSESIDLAGETDNCAAISVTNPAHHVVVTLDEDNACLRECAVCLGDYDEGERIKLLPPCGHRFHADCIDLWLSSKSTCPICRKDLRPDSVAAGDACEKPLQNDDEELRNARRRLSEAVEAGERIVTVFVNEESRETSDVEAGSRDGPARLEAVVLRRDSENGVDVTVVMRRDGDEPREAPTVIAAIA
ncbi:hypothetical protein CLOM_g4574 [Closterium sp. NIES-68]|nr:hypothetical protein CLOM_g4574 [Closterium sp. NIES-68]GJP82083.1 hypothetical protein CLOP_g12306 [Closterium sp. NIES-67]